MNELALNIQEAFSLNRLYAYEGFDKEQGGWPVPTPVNAHGHFRCPETQSDIFELSIIESAKLYDWVTAMSNLGVNRIVLADQAINYRRVCRELGRKYNPRFDVIVPLYLEPDTKRDVVRAGYVCGAWKCAKLYPLNGTTGSDYGVDFRDISKLFPVFELMEELGMLLLVHGESVLDEHGCLIPDRKREPLAIPVIEKILAHCPKIRLVFEHVSSRAAIAAVKEWQRRGYRVEATIAPQYLVWNSTEITRGGMNTVRWSIPILKDEADRISLIRFIVAGGGMLGTDNAPHDLKAKMRAIGCPGGVFNEPVGLFVYFHIFRAHGGAYWFENFKKFACYKAREFYGEPLPAETEKIVIVEKSWDVRATYKNGGVEVSPMYAGMTMPYSVKGLEH